MPHHILHCKNETKNEKNADSLAEKIDTTDVADISPALLEGNLATTKAKSRVYPIFGKKYAHTPLKNNRLAGQVFYVTSGHGGPDPGAIGRVGSHLLCEDEYAYDVSLRLVRLLIEQGATAYMITRDPNDGIRSAAYLKCDKDELGWNNTPIPAGQKARLFQRSNGINKLYGSHRKAGAKVQRFISIHVDSRAQNQRTDVFFYYETDSESSKRVANNLHSIFQEKYKQYQKGKTYRGTVTARSLYVMRETKPTAVYVELGNIKNASDQQRFIIEKNRQYLAEWLFEGLTK